MKRWARAMAVGAAVAIGGLPCLGHAAEVRLRTCLSQGETRDIMQAQRLIQPFRAMAEASRAGVGEPIGIRLCRNNAQMVYEVTLLRHEGQLVRILVDASNGATVTPHVGP